MANQCLLSSINSRRYLKPLIALIIVAITCACNKKSTSSHVTPVNPNSPTINPVLFNGVFKAEEYELWDHGFAFGKNYQTKVILTETAQTENSLVIGANLGTVKSNSIGLQFNKSIRIYMDSTGNLSYSNQIRFEHSSASLGTINFVNPDTFPRYNSALAISVKDTIDKTKGFVIPLNNLNHFNLASVGLRPGISLSIVTKTVSAGATNIVFSPSDLAALPSGKGCQIRLVLSKFNDQTINGKLFRFQNDSYNDFGAFIK